MKEMVGNNVGCVHVLCVCDLWEWGSTRAPRGWCSTMFSGQMHQRLRPPRGAEGQCILAEG